MNFFDAMPDLYRPTVTKKPWMANVSLILATADMLDQIAEECIAAGRYGLDLETTGLDSRAFPTDNGQKVTNDKIVGVCIAPSITKGYYIPVRHRDDGAKWNVPPRLVAAMLRKIQEGRAVAVFHNAKFDQKFLKYEASGDTGDWDNPQLWDDTLIIAYLRDPREKRIGLKHLSQQELKREMIELDDLFLKEKGKKVNKDFSTLDPSWEPTIWYAAADAVNTLALWYKLSPLVLEKDTFGNSQKTVYALEKACLTATIWMEQCRIYIDRKKVIELIQLGQKEWWECICQVYREVSLALGRDVQPFWVPIMERKFDSNTLDPNYMEVRELCLREAGEDMRPGIPKSVPSLTDPKVRETVSFNTSYDITIPEQFGMMLRELGVKGLTATEKSGQVKTAKEELERVIEEAGDQYPWMGSVKRFREVQKSLSNVLFNLYYDTSKERSPDGRVWANFNGFKVDTGRFSTPTPRDGEFFGQVNWNVHSTKASAYDPKNPPPVCVYKQRECVAAEPGSTLFAIDFSGVELRIVTNIAGEPKWRKEFFRCSSCNLEFDQGSLPPPFCPDCGSDKIGDLHSMTALNIFPHADPKGDPKAFKLLRGYAKTINFLLCYGGSGNAVQRKISCEEEEGWRIKNSFDKTYTGLLKWWRSQELVAQKQKYVLTAFGRKYPVPDIDSEFAKFRSKAKRNAVNGPVQGSSADIMKFAMALLYREFKKRDWLEKVKMVITIHDELVFEIKNEIMGEAVPVIERIMCVETVSKLGWVIPLKVDVEFGPDWTVKKNLTEMTWNKSDGWTEELVQHFQKQYSHYLSKGGKPLNAQVVSPMPIPKQAVPPPMIGKSFLYKITKDKLTPQTAERLASVVFSCKGKGVDSILIQDEDGNDLIGGEFLAAWDEFRVLCGYEGV